MRTIIIEPKDVIIHKKAMEEITSDSRYLFCPIKYAVDCLIPMSAKLMINVGNTNTAVIIPLPSGPNNLAVITETMNPPNNKKNFVNREVIILKSVDLCFSCIRSILYFESFIINSITPNILLRFNIVLII